MTSKEIHFFGLITSALLISFIILYVGKDFYQRIYHKVQDTDTLATIEHTLPHPIVKQNAMPVQKKTVTKGKKDHLADDIILKNKEAEVKKEKHTVKGITPDINTLIKNLLQEGKFFQQTNSLQNDDKMILDKVVVLLKNISYPYVLEIEGHTQKGVAVQVSQDMAKKVQSYIQKFLNDIKIETKGYANMYPVSDDLYSSVNRRIEILVRRK